MVYFPIEKGAYIDKEICELRGIKISRDGFAVIPITCKNLTPDGKCRVQDNKPQFCKDFVAGGGPCAFCRMLYRTYLGR